MFWLLVPVLYGLLFYNLGGVGMLDRDEPRYASIGRAMAESGDWITPRLWGEYPWFEKPALLYWMVAIGTKVGLPDEWAARLPVALASLAFLLFFYWRVRIEFNETRALYATVVLATSAGWVAYGQLALTDLPMSAALGGCLLLLMPWWRRGETGTLWWAGVAMGFAILAKGLVPVVLALPVAWFARERWREAWKPGLAAVAVAAPWYVACYAANGWRFIDVFFLQHHFGRFSSEALQHVQPAWYYVPVLLAALFPWTPVFLAPFFTSRWVTEQGEMFIRAWLVWGFVFFTSSTNKLPGYLLPLLPAAAILIAITLDEMDRAWIALAASGLLLGFVPVIAAILPTVLASGGLSRANLTGAPWGLAGLGVAAAALIVYREYTATRTSTVLLLGLLSALGVIHLKRTVYPVLDAEVSARQFWRAIAFQRDGMCTGNLRRDWRYGLSYYAKKPLPDCEVTRKPLVLEQGDTGKPKLYNYDFRARPE